MPQRPVDWYVQEYDRLLEEFVDTFSAYEKAAFNAPHRPGKWSPGQIIDHLLRAERGTLKLLERLPADAPVRDYDGKCETLARSVPDSRQAYPAHESIHPEAVGAYAPAELLDAFVDQRADIRSAVDFADEVGRVVEAFAHPAFGTLTMCEWLYFTALHGERHRLQVRQVQ